MISRTKRASKLAFSEEMSAQAISMECTYLQCTYLPMDLRTGSKSMNRKWAEKAHENVSQCNVWYTISSLNSDFWYETIQLIIYNYQTTTYLPFVTLLSNFVLTTSDKSTKFTGFFCLLNEPPTGTQSCSFCSIYLCFIVRGVVTFLRVRGSNLFLGPFCLKKWEGPSILTFTTVWPKNYKEGVWHS